MLLDNPIFVSVLYIVLSLFGPIYPAYLFYKHLPADTVVSGPLKGFKINLTGAFAGYFILFIVVLSCPKRYPEPFEIWTVKGAVSTDTPIQSSDEIIVTVVPPLYSTFRQPGRGSEPVFMTTLVVGRKANGTLDFPRIQIQRQPTARFNAIDVPLDDGFYAKFPEVSRRFKIQRDLGKHEIDITSGIMIERGPTYLSSAGTP